ncbi:DJ-1/PfpI family protein [Desulfosporosinus sp. OT]|uniref:DJ-1/PfpI family protein n=1 Tax=Desulfosporosinus sp. OT TaxID=913865 RepID=UPI000223B264|nr:DJ-1/PfpI family protein [Desulfosporosinus sp. OT]EGW38185.1 DJ-1/PfpI family protein [Desulfosporosinus sp. OT]
MRLLTKRVGIFLFDGVEVMDFAGPYEVFTATNLMAPRQYFDVFTVNEQRRDVRTSNGLIVKADYDFSNCPPADVLVIPGGDVRPELISNGTVLKWIESQNQNTEITFSVCNGAMLLAKAGLLKGLSATTHHYFYDKLSEIDSTINVVQKIRYVDTGKIVTSAGISAGIDAALHIVLRIFGEEAVSHAIDIMEYESTAYKNNGSIK